MTIHINHYEKALVDSTTGDLVRPSCFDTLVAYHSYLVNKRNTVTAKRLLQDAFSGKLVISKMIEAYQNIR
jgi:hypothetical protein